MARWIIDAMHSEVQFKVKHLVISTVTGSFNKFSADLESNNEDFTDAKVNFTADVNSISTNNEQRDGHLKSDDFFNAEKYPQLTFVGTSMEKKGNSEYVLKGNLTIRDITQPLELAVELGGIATDPYGQTKVGFEAVGKINRKAFGLAWSAVTEAGSIVVSDEVKLLLNVQFIKQA
jgi:polyisoprenoid-binding protein YceI